MPKTHGLPEIVLPRFRRRYLVAMLLCFWMAGCAPRPSGPLATVNSDEPESQTRFIGYAPGVAHSATVTEKTPAMPAQPEPPVATPQAAILETPAASVATKPAAVPRTPTGAAAVPTEVMSAHVPQAAAPQAIAAPPAMPVEAKPNTAQPELAIAAIITASEKALAEVEKPAAPTVATPGPQNPRGPDEIIASYETRQQTATPTLSDYVLSPGDVIEISVWGEDMTLEIVVPPDGKISYFLIGRIKVADRTMEEIRGEIEARLVEYIRSPKVIVLGKSFIGNAASVLGAVNQPGQKTINPGDRVTDLLAKAGGFMYVLGDNTAEDSRLMADLPDAYLSRHGKNQDIDMARLLDQGDMSQNVLLQKGDFLFIPYAKRANVYALGEVANPTVIHFRENLTLLDAIAHAGGLNKTTYKDEVCIVRGSLKNPEVIRLHYPSILKGIEPNRLLMAGDIVYVPATMVTSIERLSRQIIPFLDALVRRKEAM